MYLIPEPLKKLMLERDTIQAQIQKLQNDYELLSEEKQREVEKYDKRLNEMATQQAQLQGKLEQYEQAIMAMKEAFKLPDEEQEPPEVTE